MKLTRKILAATLSAVLLAACFQPYNVFAGASTETIGADSYQEALNTSVWSNPDADVIAEDGKIIFPAESTKYTRLITMAVMEKEETAKELAHVTYKQNIASMPEGGRFILAFGLGSLESLSGEVGQVEVAFMKSGGMKVAIDSYETAGEATSVVAAKSVSLSKDATIDVAVGNDKTIVVKVNGQVAASGKLGFDPVGSVGFFQSGECAVTLSDLSIKSYRYDNPENSNFTETFDEGGYNTNLLFSTAHAANYVPSTMSIEEYEGEYMMLYENSGLAQIGTRQQYSNFELSFDVPFMLRANRVNEKGDITHVKSAWVGVSFGDESMDPGTYGFNYSPELVYVTSNLQTWSLAQGEKMIGESAKYKLIKSSDDTGFSVKVSVVDSHVKVGLKWLYEKEFTTVAEYNMADGSTPLGYVHIWTCGPGNFGVDNIKMKNLDKNPNLVEVEYKASGIKVPKDWEYTEDLGKEANAKEQTGGFNWYYTIPITAIVMAAAVGVTVLLGKKKKNKAEGGSEKSEE